MKKQPSKKSSSKTKPRKFKTTAGKKIEQQVVVKEKEKKDKFYFPRFYRFFPAIQLKNPFSFKKTFLFACSLYALYVFIIFAITSISMDIYKNITIEQEVYAKRSSLYHQKNYWEKVIETHPGYRDAYYNLAVLELQLGNKENAKKHLERVLQIDPTFQKGRELEKILNSGSS